MLFKRKEGFTLVEVLAGINLSLVLVTLIVSFYLFSVKFISSTTKNLEDKQTVSNFLFKLNERLKKSDDYFVKWNDDKVYFVSDNIDTIILDKNIFRINNLFAIENVGEYSLTIYLKNKKKVFIRDGILKSSPFLFEKNKIISSADINSINISFLAGIREYNLFFANRLYGDKVFKNISK